MHKSKLILLLKTLSTKDLRSLKCFVESPFFNKNEQLVLFYKYLLKQAPHFKDVALDRKTVYRVVFKEKQFEQKQLYYLESNLVKLVEKYLLVTEFQNDELMPEYYLQKAAVKRGLEKTYAENLRRVKAQMDKARHSEIAFYNKKYLFYDLENEKFLTSDIRKADDSIQRASDHFDRFYLAQKLRYACEILSRNKILKSDYTIMLFEELKSHIEKNSYEDIPVIHAYSLIFFILLKRDEEKCFEELKALLMKQSQIFKKENLYDLIIYALNFCFEQMRKGTLVYHVEALELYIVGLESDVLFNDGFLSPWNFKNIVRLGINLKRYDWTTDFIYKYSSKLPPDSRDNAMNYNLAELFYAKEDWGQTIEHLTRVKFTDISYGLGTRLLLCKVYYQTNETEALVSLINSFKIFLKRQKGIAEDVKTAHLNFLKFLKILLRKEVPNSVIRDEITATPVLVLRNWLLGILEN